MDNEWTVVTRKKVNTKINNKPQKFINKVYRIPIKKDMTLTEQEKELIKKEQQQNSKLNLFCYCCMSELVSDIICRTFISCGNCYCCGNGNTTEFVTRYCLVGSYNKKYHYSQDN